MASWGRRLRWQRGLIHTAPAVFGLAIAGLVAAPSSTPPAWGPSDEGVWTTPDGESVYYACYGDGSPVIILEAGADSAASQTYRRPFLEPLAERTTTCVYDRLGTGASDPPLDQCSDARRHPSRARGSARGTGWPAPYVLVGQSSGGNFHIDFAAHHADEVAGLVLIEAYHDDPEAHGRITGRGGFDPTDTPEHVDWTDGSIRLDELPFPFGDFPVMVITATHADEGNVENQAYWLDISPDSVQVVLEGSHNLHSTTPAQSPS